MFSVYKKANKIRSKFIVCICLLFSVLSNGYAETGSIGAPVPEPIEKTLQQTNDMSNDVIDTTMIGDGEREYSIYKKHNTESPCDRSLDTYNYQKQWYDKTQIFLNSKLCQPALWFDDFFSNDRVFDDGIAGTYVRLRNEINYDEEDHFEFKMGISASVVLPGFKNRLRLTFSNENDEDLRDIIPGNGEDTTNSLGLQFDLFKNLHTKFNVSFNLKPRLRFRYRLEYPVSEKLRLRLTQEVQREKGVVDARTRFDAEHSFLEWLIFRSSTELELSEEYDGYDWAQAFVVFQRVNKKASLSYVTSINGISHPRFMDTNYRVAVRYKQNFHRRWLFYEVVPELTWPITLNDNRKIVEKERRSKWQLLFRLEIHFGNSYRKSYKDYF